MVVPNRRETLARSMPPRGAGEHGAIRNPRLSCEGRLLTRLLRLRRGVRRRCAQRKAEFDILGRLLELLSDRGTHDFGKFAERLGVVKLREGDGHPDEPPILPVETYARLQAGRLLEVNSDGVRV